MTEILISGVEAENYGDIIGSVAKKLIDAIDDGDVSVETKRKELFIKIENYPEQPGAESNGKTENGNKVSIDIDKVYKGKDLLQLQATTLHELVHVFNPSLHKTGNTDTENVVHASKFYEEVDRVAGILGIDPRLSGTLHTNYPIALKAEGREFVVEGPSSSGFFEFEFANSIPSGEGAASNGHNGLQINNSDRDPAPHTPGGNLRPGDQHPPLTVQASTGHVSGESAANNGHGGSNQHHYDQVIEAAKRGVKIGGLPILLDLDGDGIEITELSKSTQFIDAGGVGLKHRTAWAGAGDGVLFIDADNDSTISQKREYVFTEWDPTAQTDMQALRARFDSNGDGKLTAADTDFAKFKGVVTGANGSTSVQNLAA